MPTRLLADFIERNLPKILEGWAEYASRQPLLADVDRTALRAHAESLLLGVAGALRTPPYTPETAAAAAQATASFCEQLTTHQLLAEFRAIRASVLQLWTAAARSAQGDIEELARFNEAIDEAIAVAVQGHSEKAEQARAMILGILAHDLRNPLNAIHFGMQSLIRTADAGSPGRQIADLALRSVERMDTLIRDLLAFTVLQLGSGLQIHPQPVDVTELCDRAVEEVLAAHPGRHIHCQVEPQLQGRWDLARVQQLLVNLLSNGLRHGDPQGDVTLTAGHVDDTAVIDVHNHGPVIPEAVRRSMFQPLNGSRMLSDDDSAGSFGVGLGLYIAREIALAHGGSVNMTSAEGVGTTFTVRLPLQAAEHPPASA